MALLFHNPSVPNTRCGQKYYLFYVIYYSGAQVETMLLDTGSEGRSMAAQAALGGDKPTFKVMSTAIGEKLEPKQVRYRM